MSSCHHDIMTSCPYILKVDELAESVWRKKCINCDKKMRKLHKSVFFNVKLSKKQVYMRRVYIENKATTTKGWRGIGAMQS